MLRFVLRPIRGDGLDVALASRPDGVILDFAGVTAAHTAARWEGGPTCLARLSFPPDAGFEAELEAAMAWYPTGVLARGTGGLSDVEHVGARLAVAEATHGVGAGEIGITVLADDARSVRALRTLRPIPRLRGVAFDPGALAASSRCSGDASAIGIGAAEAVLAAAACGVPSLVVVSSDDWRDRATREGFGGVVETTEPQLGRPGSQEPDPKHPTTSS